MHARKQSAPIRATARPATAGRVNSIGMGQRDLAPFLDEIDNAGLAKGARRRGFVRWPFRHSAIPVTIVHPGGNSVTLNVACRNLSCGGMSLLHNSYLYTGSRCAVTLPHPRHGRTMVNGTVARCLHVRGTIHEVGIAFDAPISAREFVDIDLFADWFSLEQVEPTLLTGRILCACTSPMDSKLMGHFFRTSRAILTHASTFEEALAGAQSGCDLVVADLDLGGRSGGELILELRCHAIWTPVVLLLTDLSAASRSRALGSGASGFLCKPLAQDRLLRAAGEFLLVAGASDALLSTLPRDHPNIALVPGFVSLLAGYAARLEEAVKADQVAECRSICVAIQGSAPALGFERLAQIADAAAQATTGATPLQTSPGAVRVLIMACRAISPGPVPGR